MVSAELFDVCSVLDYIEARMAKLDKSMAADREQAYLDAVAKILVKEDRHFSAGSGNAGVKARLERLPLDHYLEIINLASTQH